MEVTIRLHSDTPTKFSRPGSYKVLEKSFIAAAAAGIKIPSTDPVHGMGVKIILWWCRTLTYYSRSEVPRTWENHHLIKVGQFLFRATSFTTQWDLFHKHSQDLPWQAFTGLAVEDYVAKRYLNTPKAGISPSFQCMAKVYFKFKSQMNSHEGWDNVGNDLDLLSHQRPKDNGTWGWSLVMGSACVPSWGNQHGQWTPENVSDWAVLAWCRQKSIKPWFYGFLMSVAGL